MDSSSGLFWTLAAIGFLLFVCSIKLKASHSRPLPPGPIGHWFFGIKKQLPHKEPWKTYASWSKLYDESVISFQVYNRTIIVLNDVQSVTDLLERRANIYSDRPEQYMSHTICGRSKTVFNISSQDPHHRIYRRLVQEGTGSRSTKAYWPVLQEELGKLLEGLGDTPENYVQHVRRNFVGVIMRVAYGYTIAGLDDTFVRVAEETTRITDKTMANGSWLVDYYPIARYIPPFLPGGGFKCTGKVWRERLSYLSDVPHQWVKKQMATGTYAGSFTSSLLTEDGVAVGKEREDIIRWCAGGLYVGASDTTVSAITSFILLMALHPNVQTRAQTEIDEICGRHQAPHPSHLGFLRYLQAVLREVLRYAPVGNLALPHKVTEEDTYRGYRIPKNATVMGNVWAIMHDPSLFPNPDIFNPDRFLESKLRGWAQPDPCRWAFGFGRRACPGTHFAETSMLFAMAGILSEFSISLPGSSDGANTAKPKISFTTGITRYLTTFRSAPRAKH
ncbi:cytochrome P450 [Macrolepiota fuliginosa MF-IS2]|uniref:Cytochrome P450 n=1 Tax=Macrolepiota fuliginosa MF-IS2 TaxID=1400762 RepID=A0A9P6C601_9AGAR|nr:cytochrome P450 [Macrolepiota fuliginosa MF-IS2]